MDKVVIVPPVEVVSVPRSAGNRDWGCKILDARFIIPYNDSVKASYADIDDIQTYRMDRELFGNLKKGDDILPE